METPTLISRGNYRDYVSHDLMYSGATLEVAPCANKLQATESWVGPGNEATLEGHPELRAPC